EQNNIKKAEITKRVLENKTEAAVLEETLKTEEQALAEITDHIRAIDDTLLELRNSRQALEQKEEALRREHRDTQQQFHMENSRLLSLRNLTERYEGYGQSIKRIMEQKQGNQGIVGVVADIIRVKKEYEVAVETALGGSIQNIVTDNEQTAKEMIAFLKKNRYGRATFLPLTNMRAKPVNLSGNLMSEKGVIGMASTLVEAEARFSNLVEYLLGRFVVVDTIDNAISLAKKYHHTIRIVTTEGELLNPGGSMSGGAFKNSQNLLGRRREMDDLEKRSRELKEKLKELSQDIAGNEKESAETAEKISANRKIRQELSLKQNTAKLNYDRAAKDKEKNEEQLEFIRMENSQLEERRESLKKEIEQINEQVLSNENLSKEREKRIEELSVTLEQLREKYEEQSKEQADRLLEITAQKQSSQFIQENLNRIADTAAGLEEELKQVLEGGRDADRQVIQKEEEIERAKAQIVSIQRHIQELSDTIGKETKEKEELNIRHKGFFEKREELSARKSELDKECFRLDNQKEKLAERIDSYTNYMWEQYELTYHTAEEKKTEVSYSLSQMRTEISKLKSKMKALGDVNVNAIEQYKEVQERYDLLHTQHDDLIEAANVLMGIIGELDVEMRRQFEEQFQEIRMRFDNVFKELFGGGRGTLELTEEEDILTAGIRIVAQPPGKKLQNMMQLSGGEKALTAIALLFAIQSLKPSPFCLLDEIEAALDDSNVSRYAQYLH
ncbi:MAG: chromosome segregation protein SMC, partial [Lachnospiraceae bacterium]|nr:chromosome segregation protein SMC [Lachnospiraceae bacterium]